MNGQRDYNDDAFGFVFLGGYLVTGDALFAVTFLLLSALAAIATRSGKLPATSIVPAAVAGCTYIVNFVIPSDKLYEIIPVIEKAETLLPLDSSWLELGICSVSILYNFIQASSNQEEGNP